MEAKKALRLMRSQRMDATPEKSSVLMATVILKVKTFRCVNRDLEATI